MRSGEEECSPRADNPLQLREAVRFHRDWHVLQHLAEHDAIEGARGEWERVGAGGREAYIRVPCVAAAQGGEIDIYRDRRGAPRRQCAVMAPSWHPTSNRRSIWRGRCSKAHRPRSTRASGEGAGTAATPSRLDDRGGSLDGAVSGATAILGRGDALIEIHQALARTAPTEHGSSLDATMSEIASKDRIATR